MKRRGERKVLKPKQLYNMILYHTSEAVPFWARPFGFRGFAGGDIVRGEKGEGRIIQIGRSRPRDNQPFLKIIVDISQNIRYNRWVQREEAALWARLLA